MKLKWKIYILCLCVYIMTIILAAVIVTASSYNSSLKHEISRSIDEEQGIKKNITVYLAYNTIPTTEGTVKLENYADNIKNMFSSSSLFLQIYSKDGALLSTSFPINYTNSISEMSELDTSKYIFKRLEGKHYLIIMDKAEFNSDYLTISTIKDITYIDIQKNSMYTAFLQASLIGLIIISFLVIILGGFITKPIEYLTGAVKKISSGSYGDRVNISSKDEIGTLSQQFNIMAEEIENRIQQLELAAENKQNFIDNLTHELRTPLTSIIGYSELLIGIKYDESSFSKGLGFINSEGNRILNMVNSLMDLILTRTAFIKPMQCSISKIVSSSMDAIELKCKEKNIKLICHGEDYFFTVAETLFKMVLINILDNAVKASYADSIIEISYSRTSSDSIITIKDYGCGISEEHIEKILEPFYRVDKSRSRKEGGLGLGLALAKSIVASHNGHIAIKSEIGKGTSISICIPQKEVN